MKVGTAWYFGQTARLNSGSKNPKDPQPQQDRYVISFLRLQRAEGLGSEGCKSRQLSAVYKQVHT